MLYNNPVIPGFYPDPSVCRVGDDYYLVTSSFEYFPGIPLFHSKDLIHWEQIGHCLSRSTQIGLSKDNPNGMGIYAPTIRCHEGRFYVITTNVASRPERGGNFLVWTDDPRGEWSDPVWIDLPGIDPSLYFDDDGKVYYTGAHQGIYLCEIDVQTGAVVGPVHRVWDGTGGADAEAPHLYRMHGYYYLMIAEGGTSQGHMVTIARSRSVEGPYESCPRNPVLSNRSLPLPIKATGHADLIEAHDGSWWAVLLGIRPVPYPERHHLGRETFLAPVRWDDELWPIIGNNGTIDLEMEADCLPAVPVPAAPERDDFDGGKLTHSWNFLYTPDEARWSLELKDSCLALLGGSDGLSDKGAIAWVGRRQQHMNCEATTRLLFEPQRDGEEAGLTVFLNRDHHYEIALARIGGAVCIIMRRRIGSLWKVEHAAPYTDRSVLLKLSATPHMYSFSYAAEEDGAWTELGQGEVHYLSTEVGGKFTGNYIALYAAGGGSVCGVPAFFDWFDYKPSVAEA